MAVYCVGSRTKQGSRLLLWKILTSLPSITLTTDLANKLSDQKWLSLNVKILKLGVYISISPFHGLIYKSPYRHFVGTRTIKHNSIIINWEETLVYSARQWSPILWGMLYRSNLGHSTLLSSLKLYNNSRQELLKLMFCKIYLHQL